MEEIEKIRRFVERFEDIDGKDDDEIIAEFNDMLAETGKEYWFCSDCGRFHPRQWRRCDLPCVQYEQSRQITEDEWEQVYSFFDPADYRQDDAHLQFPHTRFSSWMNTAQKLYNLKKENLLDSKLCRACELWGVKEININDLSRPMTKLEQGLRRFEIQRFRGKQTFWKDLESLLDFYIENAPSQ